MLLIKASLSSYKRTKGRTLGPIYGVLLLDDGGLALGIVGIP